MPPHSRSGSSTVSAPKPNHQRIRARDFAVEARHRAGALSLEHAEERKGSGKPQQMAKRRRNAATLAPWQLYMYAAAAPAAQSVSAPKPNHQRIRARDFAVEARHRAGALSLEHAGARGAAADGEEASQNAATLEPWQLYNAAAVPAAQSVSAPKPSHQRVIARDFAVEPRHRAGALSLEHAGEREAAVDGEEAAQCRHTRALAALCSIERRSEEKSLYIDYCRKIYFTLIIMYRNS